MKNKLEDSIQIISPMGLSVVGTQLYDQFGALKVGWTTLLNLKYLKKKFGSNIESTSDLDNASNVSLQR
jgi:hypothetical protein